MQPIIAAPSISLPRSAHHGPVSGLGIAHLLLQPAAALRLAAAVRLAAGAFLGMSQFLPGFSRYRGRRRLLVELPSLDQLGCPPLQVAELPRQRKGADSVRLLETAELRH
ncbi:MAG: hypothetical protein EBU59_07855 [Planctomycetia bacterium]|nr:hypothetical protein [Planctomycetia bacterium]